MQRKGKVKHLWAPGLQILRLQEMRRDHLTGLLSGCFTITVNTLPRLGKILLQICLLGFVSMEKKRLFEDTTAHTHPHTQ